MHLVTQKKYFSPCILIWVPEIKKEALLFNYQRLQGFVYCMIKFLAACLYEDVLFESQWSYYIQQHQSAWFVCMTNFTWTRNIILNIIFMIYILWVTTVCSVIDNWNRIELEKFIIIVLKNVTGQKAVVCHLDFKLRKVTLHENWACLSLLWILDTNTMDDALLSPACEWLGHWDILLRFY